jgi:hypothetical protein
MDRSTARRMRMSGRMLDRERRRPHPFADQAPKPGPIATTQSMTNYAIEYTARKIARLPLGSPERAKAEWQLRSLLQDLEHERCQNVARASLSLRPQETRQRVLGRTMVLVGAARYQTCRDVPRTMKTPASIVQSTFDFAIREINALEQRIFKAEGDADSMLWVQAREVVSQLDAGIKQTALAARWLNSEGKPYSQAHVSYTAQVYRYKFTDKPRPRFRDAYNAIANRKMGVHHSSQTPEHYTPKALLDLVIELVGAIDLDPCSNRGKPNVPAKRHFTEKENGLERPWAGRVFVNPPYGDQIAAWTKKIREEGEAEHVSEVVALLPARPDTEWWDALTTGTDSFVACFFRGRLKFVGNQDSAPFPSVVVYFGPKHDLFAHIFQHQGGLWVRPPVDFFVNHETQRPDVVGQ